MIEFHIALLTCGAQGNEQACKPKFRLKELASILCSATVLVVCFEGCMAGLDATEIGNELYQPTFEFASLAMTNKLHSSLCEH